jgi:hypothetical protein
MWDLLVLGTSFQHWPDGDPDTWWALGDTWQELGDEIHAAFLEMERYALVVGPNWVGDSGQAFFHRWREFVDGEASGPVAFVNAALQYANACHNGALNLELTQLTLTNIVVLTAIMVTLGVLFAEFGGLAISATATATGRALTSTALHRLATVMTEQFLQQTLKQPVKMVLKEGAKAAIRSGSIFTLADLMAQGVQISKGHREDVDWAGVGSNFLGGAAAGLVAALTGVLFGRFVGKAMRPLFLHEAPTLAGAYGRILLGKTGELFTAFVANIPAMPAMDLASNFARTGTLGLTHQYLATLSLTNIFKEGLGGAFEELTERTLRLTAKAPFSINAVVHHRPVLSYEHAHVSVSGIRADVSFGRANQAAVLLAGASIEAATHRNLQLQALNQVMLLDGHAQQAAWDRAIHYEEAARKAEQRADDAGTKAKAAGDAAMRNWKARSDILAAAGPGANVGLPGETPEGEESGEDEERIDLAPRGSDRSIGDQGRGDHGHNTLGTTGVPADVLGPNVIRPDDTPDGGQPTPDGLATGPDSTVHAGAGPADGGGGESGTAERARLDTGETGDVAGSPASADDVVRVTHAVPVAGGTDTVGSSGPDSHGAGAVGDGRAEKLASVLVALHGGHEALKSSTAAGGSGRHGVGATRAQRYSAVTERLDSVLARADLPKPTRHLLQSQRDGHAECHAAAEAILMQIDALLARTGVPAALCEQLRRMADAYRDVLAANEAVAEQTGLAAACQVEAYAHETSGDLKRAVRAARGAGTAASAEMQHRIALRRALAEAGAALGRALEIGHVTPDARPSNPPAASNADGITTIAAIAGVVGGSAGLPEVANPSQHRRIFVADGLGEDVRGMLEELAEHGFEPARSGRMADSQAADLTERWRAARTGRPQVTSANSPEARRVDAAWQALQEWKAWAPLIVADALITQPERPPGVEGMQLPERVASPDQAGSGDIADAVSAAVEAGGVFRPVDMVDDHEFRMIVSPGLLAGHTRSVCAELAKRFDPVRLVDLWRDGGPGGLLSYWRDRSTGAVVRVRFDTLPSCLAEGAEPSSVIDNERRWRESQFNAALDAASPQPDTQPSATTGGDARAAGRDARTADHFDAGGYGRADVVGGASTRSTASVGRTAAGPVAGRDTRRSESEGGYGYSDGGTPASSAARAAAGPVAGRDSRRSESEFGYGGADAVEQASRSSADHVPEWLGRAGDVAGTPIEFVDKGFFRLNFSGAQHTTVDTLQLEGLLRDNGATCWGGSGPVRYWTDSAGQPFVTWAGKLDARTAEQAWQRLDEWEAGAGGTAAAEAARNAANAGPPQRPEAAYHPYLQGGEASPDAAPYRAGTGDISILARAIVRVSVQSGCVLLADGNSFQLVFPPELPPHALPEATQRVMNVLDGIDPTHTSYPRDPEGLGGRIVFWHDRSTNTRTTIRFDNTRSSLTNAGPEQRRTVIQAIRVWRENRAVATVVDADGATGEVPPHGGPASSDLDGFAVVLEAAVGRPGLRYADGASGGFVVVLPAERFTAERARIRDALAAHGFRPDSRVGSSDESDGDVDYWWVPGVSRPVWVWCRMPDSSPGSAVSQGQPLAGSSAAEPSELGRVPESALDESGGASAPEGSGLPSVGSDVDPSIDRPDGADSGHAVERAVDTDADAGAAPDDVSLGGGAMPAEGGAQAPSGGPVLSGLDRFAALLGAAAVDSGGVWSADGASGGFVVVLPEQDFAAKRDGIRRDLVKDGFTSLNFALDDGTDGEVRYWMVPGRLLKPVGVRFCVPDSGPGQAALQGRQLPGPLPDERGSVPTESDRVPRSEESGQPVRSDGTDADATAGDAVSPQSADAESAVAAVLEHARTRPNGVLSFSTGGPDHADALPRVNGLKFVEAHRDDDGFVTVGDVRMHDVDFVQGLAALGDRLGAADDRLLFLPCGSGGGSMSLAQLAAIRLERYTTGADTYVWLYPNGRLVASSPGVADGRWPTVPADGVWHTFAPNGWEVAHHRGDAYVGSVAPRDSSPGDGSIDRPDRSTEAADGAALAGLPGTGSRPLDPEPPARMDEADLGKRSDPGSPSARADSDKAVSEPRSHRAKVSRGTQAAHQSSAVVPHSDVRAAQLRAEGLSHAAIGAVLERERVLTPSGKRHWSVQNVESALARFDRARAVTRAVALRAKGLFPAEIAAVLNSAGVRAPSGELHWSEGNVERVLARFDRKHRPGARAAELRAHDMSQSQIAAVLERERVPTPSGRGSWTNAMVRRVLDRFDREHPDQRQHSALLMESGARAAELRALGMPTAQIAATLERKGVLTPSGRRRWNKHLVQRVLDRFYREHPDQRQPSALLMESGARAAELRALGMPTRQIADTLTSERVPTLFGESPWNRKLVQRVLDHFYREHPDQRQPLAVVMETATRAAELRALGMPLVDIAATLTSERVPPPYGKGPWRIDGVQDVLARFDREYSATRAGALRAEGLSLSGIAAALTGERVRNASGDFTWDTGRVRRALDRFDRRTRDRSTASSESDPAARMEPATQPDEEGGGELARVDKSDPPAAKSDKNPVAHGVPAVPVVPLAEQTLFDELDPSDKETFYEITAKWVKPDSPLAEVYNHLQYALANDMGELAIAGRLAIVDVATILDASLAAAHGTPDDHYHERRMKAWLATDEGARHHAEQTRRQLADVAHEPTDEVLPAEPPDSFGKLGADLQADFRKLITNWVRMHDSPEQIYATIRYALDSELGNRLPPGLTVEDVARMVDENLAADGRAVLEPSCERRLIDWLPSDNEGQQRFEAEWWSRFQPSEHDAGALVADPHPPGTVFDSLSRSDRYTFYCRSGLWTIGRDPRYLMYAPERLHVELALAVHNLRTHPHFASMTVRDAVRVLDYCASADRGERNEQRVESKLLAWLEGTPEGQRVELDYTATAEALAASRIAPPSVAVTDQFGHPLYQPNEAEFDLLNKEVVWVSRLDGGSTEAYLVRFADGSAAVYKPHGWRGGRVRDLFDVATVRELAAAGTHRLLGLDLMPTTVRWVGHRGEGSLMTWVADAQQDKQLSRYERADREQVAVFDYIVGNLDRTGNNFLTCNGRPLMIDHGLTFPDDGESPIKSDFVAWFFGREVSPETLTAVDAVDPSDLATLLRAAGLSEPAVVGSVARLEEIQRRRGITGETWPGRIVGAQGTVVAEAHGMAP